MHVLAINTGKPEAIDALTDRFAVDCTVLTEAKYAPMYRNDQTVVVVDSVNDFEAVASAVEKITAVASVDRVVAPTERTVFTGGFVRGVLGLPGMQSDVARRFTDKVAMKQALVSAGIETTAFIDGSVTDQIPEFMSASAAGCIVKPAFGSGSIGATVVRTVDDLPSWVAERPTILERWVPMNAELHSEGLVRDGRLIETRNFRYHAPVLGTEGNLTGSFQITSPARSGSVDQVHQRVVSALGMQDGITHLQLFETDGGLLVNEIASRPPGGGIVEQVALAGGVDLWRAFFAAELQIDADLDHHRRKPAACAVRIKLPLPTGRVLKVSGVDELRSLPQATVQIDYGPGDEPPALIHSGTAGGYVFADVPDEVEAKKVFARVGQAFRFVHSEVMGR